MPVFVTPPPIVDTAKNALLVNGKELKFELAGTTLNITYQEPADSN